MFATSRNIPDGRYLIPNTICNQSAHAFLLLCLDTPFRQCGRQRRKISMSTRNETDASNQHKYLLSIKRKKHGTIAFSLRVLWTAILRSRCNAASSDMFTFRLERIKQFQTNDSFNMCELTCCKFCSLNTVPL